MRKMKRSRYKKFFMTEKSINQMHQAVDALYNQYKNKYQKMTDLVDFISKKLGINKNMTLQILQLVEKENR